MIATKRLTIRPMELSDLGALETLFSDKEVMEFSNRGPEDAAWTANLIKREIGRQKTLGFSKMAVVVKATGNVIGYCGFGPDEIYGRKEIELGYRLVRAAWGRGYATEAATAMLEYGHRTLHLPRIVATIDPSNAASIKVAQKIGMTRGGEIMKPGYTHPDLVYVSET